MAADLGKALNPQGRPDFERVQGVKEAFSSSTPIPDDSGLISPITHIEGYQYIISEIEADRNCTVFFEWFANITGTQALVAYSETFTTGSGLRLIWKSVAGPFLRVTITNASGADMTRFWHRLRLTNQPILSQDIVDVITRLTAVQTEVDAEALAGRTNETTEHTSTRLTITTKSNEEQAKLDILEASLASMELDLEAINTNITTEGDQTQGLLTTIEASLTAIEANDDSNTTDIRNTIESVGEEIELNLLAIESDVEANTTQLIAVNAELDAQTALLTTIDADTGSIDTKLTTTNSSLTAIDSKITSDGTLTRTQIDLVTAEIDAEALAGRTNNTSEHTSTRTQIDLARTTLDSKITSDGALTRTQIDLATTQLEAVNAELDTQTTALGTLDSKITSDGALTRTQIDLVTTEIDAEALANRTNETTEHTTTRATINTALAIQHPRIVRAAYDQIGTDAGGRTRVSQLTTLMDGKVVNGHTPLIFESAGTGTQTIGNSKNNMAVTSGQWSIFQTKRFYPYFSGKSQVVECTFDGFAPQANVTKRFGYFSSNADSPFDTTYDGMWCENDGTTIKLRMARAGTSTLDVDITAWSGYADLGVYQNLANWDNFTVCIFDFLWLGGAVMRFWIKTPTGFVLAHIFHYASTAQDIFMLAPCHPLRYEIRSSTGSGSFRYICSQIATEGSFEEDGIVRAITTTTAPITLATAGTVYPVLALRKQSLYRCVASKLIDFNLFVNTNNDHLLYTVQINPTISGAGLTFSNVVNSSIQSAVGDGTLTVTTPGTIMASGFITQNSILPTNLLENNFLAYMGGTLANAMDQFVLCAAPLTGVTNVATFASMSYKEY